MTAPEPAPRQFATEPEEESPERPVSAFGIGPGNPSYLHPRARSILESADVLVGFETVLDRVRHLTDADVLSCTYDTEADRLAAFADRVEDGEAGAAALMGDPNVSGYAFLGKVERAVDRPVRVTPGVSSVQVAASRSRTPFESSTVVTLHARGDLDGAFDRLVREAGDRNLLLLPRPFDYMPERIASVLVGRGVDGSLPVHVHERLTFEDEACTRTTLAELAATDSTADGDGDSAFCDLSVVVVRGRR
ncbi:precorrin-6y C5,15-methyltransferase (decarboxylating) subunit CbiE [Halorarum halobium]|uniref:precorrin-6y C5,15-methyltransferase (decarboxylating) subunit CbiE n=1 Tax=Halorarum halobium TaxID=3075121 RepID=UPI0028ADAC4D|nr:precorrin-6y C5,15-methyltransferase (decarboxylating) subunit CbiE [Halobaculum sp. XH14]